MAKKTKQLPIQLDLNRTEFINNFWLNLGDTNKIFTKNIIGNDELFKENPSLGIINFMRQPENFGYTCEVLFNKRIAQYQALVLKTLWNHSFPLLIASRGGSKSFCLALYSLLRAIFIPGSKVVITGASFRQAKIIFGYIETIWKESPMLQDVLSFDKNNKPTHSTDEYSFRIDSSTIIAIPTGDGSTVRGKRSSCLVSDEFNSINVQVFEEIMQGFGAVSLNPVEAMVDYYKLLALKTLGNLTEEQFKEEQNKGIGNQTIISGTCGYMFEHLFKYWKSYREIIMGRDDVDKMKGLFGDNYGGGLSSKDFAIIRLPYELLPPKFMDEKTIAKAKATSNSSIFASEFGAEFISDTQGFFKRSLIENCTCKNNAKVPIIKKSGLVDFIIAMEGCNDLKYVMGIDPAAESDNFAITILELWPDHRRIVYSWTTNNKNHKDKLKAGLIDEHDYYRYCGRKIRELMRLFRIELIAIDSQGGGGPIREILGDPKYLQAGEHPLYPVPDPKKPRSTDHLSGRHILHMIEFSSAIWVYDANQGLRQDMETRELIFPSCDSISFGLLHEQDKLSNRIKGNESTEVDSLRETAEDVLLEIEELKNELVLIEHTKTPSGRDRWDTPQVKGLNSKKGRLRKDRYSSLLLANAVGRTMIARVLEYEYNAWGGFAKDIVKGTKEKIKEVVSIDDGFSFGGGVRRR
jgi:hypothetical protein